MERGYTWSTFCFFPLDGTWAAWNSSWRINDSPCAEENGSHNRLWSLCTLFVHRNWFATFTAAHKISRDTRTSKWISNALLHGMRQEHEKLYESWLMSILNLYIMLISTFLHGKCSMLESLRIHILHEKIQTQILIGELSMSTLWHHIEFLNFA